MRALTVRQPWAWAIIHGGKDVENRSRNIAGSYRGPVAIHAGKSVEDLHDIHDPRVAEALNRAATPDRPTVGDHITFGAIIGVADLVDVHRSQVRALQNVCFDNHTPIGQKCSPWAQQMELPGGYHLVLANPRPCEPIPCRGALGLWTVPDEVAAQLAVHHA